MVVRGRPSVLDSSSGHTQPAEQVIKTGFLDCLTDTHGNNSACCCRRNDCIGIFSATADVSQNTLLQRVAQSSVLARLPAPPSAYQHGQAVQRNAQLHSTEHCGRGAGQLRRRIIRTASEDRLCCFLQTAREGGSAQAKGRAHVAVVNSSEENCLPHRHCSRATRHSRESSDAGSPRSKQQHTDDGLPVNRHIGRKVKDLRGRRGERMPYKQRWTNIVCVAVVRNTCHLSSVSRTGSPDSPEHKPPVLRAAHQVAGHLVALEKLKRHPGAHGLTPGGSKHLRRSRELSER